MEEELLKYGTPVSKNPSWRHFHHVRPHLSYDFDALPEWDNFTLSHQKARDTGLWGDDFAVLVNIARVYQKSLLARVSYAIYKTTSLANIKFRMLRWMLQQPG